MAVGRVLLAVGIVCLAASCLAQTPATGAGSYLVDGTGVVYDPNTITIYLNGTAIGTIPIAQGPGAQVQNFQAPTPGASLDQSNLLNTILGQLGPTTNPLDKIIVGRKLKL